jgi:hypothetical protein
MENTKVIDGKYWRCDSQGKKQRLLTDKECADYIWGLPPIKLTPIEKYVVSSLHVLQDVADSYDKVYEEHEMPAGCVTSDSLPIFLTGLRKLLKEKGVLHADSI